MARQSQKGIGLVGGKTLEGKFNAQRKTHQPKHPPPTPQKDRGAFVVDFALQVCEYFSHFDVESTRLRTFLVGSLGAVSFGGPHGETTGTVTTGWEDE